MSLADLLKKSDYYEDDRQVPVSKPNPQPPFTIHTLMGDMTRQYEGGVFEYSDYKVDKAKYLLFKEMYDEWKNGKEGNYDNNRVD